MTTAAPWLARQAWKNGQIRANNVDLNLYAQIASLLISGLIIIPLVLFKRSEISTSVQRVLQEGFHHFDGYLLLLFLLLLVVIQLPLVLKAWFKWQKNRQLRLTLEPYPGRIGGQVAGRISLPYRLPAGSQASVDLNCIRDTRGQSSAQQVLWRRQAEAHVTPAHLGSEVRFNALVDADQPDASLQHVEESRNLKVAIVWMVRVQVPAVGFDESFTIPVFRLGNETARDTEPPASPETAPTRAEIATLPAEIARVEERANGFTIDYPPGRERSFGQLLLAFGAAADAGSLFMLYVLYQSFGPDQPPLFALLTKLVLFLGLAFAGSAMLLGGLYYLVNRLQVELTGDQLTITRHFFQKRFSRTLSTRDIYGFDKRISTQTDQGAHSEIEYAIRLHTQDGRCFIVGDGIKGDRHVDLLLTYLGSRLPHQPTHGRSCQEAAPPWLAAAITGAIIVSVLLGVITLALFISV